MTRLYHEELYRGSAVLSRIATCRVAICGAGALGANIAEGLARAGFGALAVIDRDRIEERNLSTQPYQRADAGSFKARVLAHMLYRAVGADVRANCVTLTGENVDTLLRDSDLVVEAFDNGASRGTVSRWAVARGIPCLHAGLADGYAEVIWNERYRVPSSSRDDVCDYPLARNLAMLASAAVCESVIRWAAGGERCGWSITLADLAIHELQPALVVSDPHS